MVIDGNTVLRKWVVLVKVVGQRVRLPADFAEMAGLSGTGSAVNCWLFVRKAGRFQLRKQSPRPTEGPIAEVLERLDEIASEDPFDATEDNEQAAIRARLIPCVVSGPRSGPRIYLPKEALQLATGDRSQVYLINVSGFVELWFPETLRAAVSVPISEVLG
jgi:hypothetical protein